LANPTGPAAATGFTDKQGHFLITEVEPGDYIVAAERDGFIRQEYGQRTDTSGGTPVTLVAGKRTTIDFQLVSAGVITGKVTDPEGSPVADARIQAYTYRYAGGKRSMASVSSAQTNDLGEYRLHPLTAGTYFISVTPRDGLPTDQIPTQPANQQGGFPGPLGGGRGGNIQDLMAQGGQQAAMIQALGLGTPPIYYPGVLDPTEAAPVRLISSSEVRNIDFNLRPILTVKVSGRVEAPFELPSEAARNEAMQNLQALQNLGNSLGGGRNGLGILGGAAAGAGGQRGGQNPAGATTNPLAGIQEMLNGVQNSINTIQPFQVRFARVGAESSSPMAALIGNGPVPVDNDGKFQVENITPGSYFLTAIGHDKKGAEYTARLRVEVGNADINGVIISPKAGVDVKGQIYISDSTPPAGFKPSQLRVSLLSDDNPNPLAFMATLLGAGSTGGMSAQVQDDGSFIIKDVGSLPYRVSLTGLPANGYVLNGRFGDIDPLGSLFSIGSSEASLQLQIGFSAGNVSANVLDSSGKPSSGIVTALVPDATRRGRSDLYFSGISDKNGRVSFTNVPPGAYRIFAWEEIPTDAFRYAEFLLAFEDRGLAVTVEKNGALTVDVKTIPKAEN
jgi:hypothetical protein